MEIIRLLVQNLIVIIILAVFLEMFLPPGDMKRYIKLVMGLLIIIAVLGALGDLVRRSWTPELPEQAVISGGQSGVAGLNEIMASADRINQHNKERAIEEYRRSLARQISALAGLSGEAEVVSVQVDIYDKEGDPKYGQLKEVRVVAKNNDSPSGQKGVTEPIKVRVGQKADEGQINNGGSGRQEQDKTLPDETKKKIITTIANFYNLSPAKVKVIESSG